MFGIVALGAGDPEMEAIEAILRSIGREFGFAAIDGSRCHPGNAYEANGVISSDTRKFIPFKGEYGNFIFVECRPAGISLAQKHKKLTVIDHHEEGDPGYSLGPADFWEASSLGQLIQLLRREGYKLTVTRKMRVLAAMDHCRQAAILDKCPGVKAEEVIALRVASIAKRHSVTTHCVQGKIEGFRKLFRERTSRPFGRGRVIDFTDRHLGTGYSLDFLCAQTALDISGLTALLRNNESIAVNTQKIMLSGHATPEMVRYFMKVYARARKLTRIFGVPKRGYAGGYLRE